MIKKIIRKYLPDLICLIGAVVLLIFGFWTGYESAKRHIEPVKEVETVEVIVEKEIVKEVPPSSQFELIGEFKLTAYCPCQNCSEGYGRSTATGVLATAGITIAVDSSVIPYGSIVVINGHTYIAQDCGGAVKGKVIDIYFDTHKEASNFGVQYAQVYLKKGN